MVCRIEVGREVDARLNSVERGMRLVCVSEVGKRREPLAVASVLRDTILAEKAVVHVRKSVRVVRSL